MNGSNRTDDENTASRRDVLKAVPTVAALSVGSSQIERAAATEDSVHLGTFEDNLDGWTTTGRTELSRVTAEEIPAGVVTGNHALSVDVNGDAAPMIENRKQVAEADFAANPYLLVHVLGYAEESDADLAFRFRLHHTDTPATGQGGNGKGSGGGPGQEAGGKETLVAESPERTVTQLNPSHLRWDMTGLDEETLRTANRLEIVWYLADHPPDRGHRGQNQGVDYQGLVAFDDIRVTADVAGAERLARTSKKLDLHRKHGMIVDREFDRRDMTLEQGTLVFVDNTEIDYTFEVLDDDRTRYTLGDETFRLGGGWA